jgi:hypothetical protein
MTTSSIKGGAYATVVEDLNRLVAGGRLTREQLEGQLSPEDLKAMGSEIQPALWYPIDSYRRMAELLLEVEGEGRSEYMVARGARSAERLLNQGLYQQLDYADRYELTGQKEAIEHATRLIITLNRSIFNFSEWSFYCDPDDERCFRIEVCKAADFPEVLRHATQGFIEFVARRASDGCAAVTSERPSPDRIVFSMHFSD